MTKYDRAFGAEGEWKEEKNLGPSSSPLEESIRNITPPWLPLTHIFYGGISWYYQTRIFAEKQRTKNIQFGPNEKHFFAILIILVELENFMCLKPCSIFGILLWSLYKLPKAILGRKLLLLWYLEVWTLSPPPHRSHKIIFVIRESVKGPDLF